MDGLTPPLTPLSTLLLERANAIVEQQRAKQKPSDYPILQQIGSCLRHWRIQKKLSRRALAKQLNIEPERLLFLETGHAQPEDITPSQLNKLVALVEQSGRNNKLKTLVQQYLAKQK